MSLAIRIPEVLILVSMTILVSCNPSDTNDPVNPSVPTHYSTSFKPMAFVSDHRSGEIQALETTIRKLFEEWAVQLHIPGLSYGVVVDGKLQLSGATGWLNIEDSIPATPGACFRIASMTKSFTAMAILKLRDEGRLDLDDPVKKYVPEMGNLEYLTSDAPVIDIENLLTMTAGFPEDNPWGDRQLDEPDKMLTGLLNEGVSFSNPPSYEYEYSNTGYALLGMIISKVAGMPYQEFIRESILEPLEMNHTYWEYEEIRPEELAVGYRWEEEQWKREPLLHDGSYGAMGGLITTIEDFSRYVAFHLSAWPPRSGPDDGPVKRSSLREMQTGQFTRLYTRAVDQDGETCAVTIGYGYGLAAYENCHGLRLVYHSGALPGFGSDYYLLPDYGIGIMAFANLTYTSPLPFMQFLKLVTDSTSLQPRELPVSDILIKRKEQVAELILHWDESLGEEILAENFFMDRSRELRMAETGKLLEQAGPIERTGELVPRNQLRGSFEMNAKYGILEVYFTLTPENDPKVQQLDITYKPFNH